jgi:hypothetical protein
MNTWAHSNQQCLRKHLVTNPVVLEYIDRLIAAHISRGVTLRSYDCPMECIIEHA